MRNIKDRMTGYLFDPWYHVGEKRLKLLKKSWAGFFREQCLPELPVDAMLSRFHTTMGRRRKFTPPWVPYSFSKCLICLTRPRCRKLPSM